MKYWDNICVQCGKCCCEKIHKDGVCYIFVDCPCLFLDTDTKKCTCFEKRFSHNPLCKRLTIFHALFSDYLPESCAYVKKFRFWRKYSKFPKEVDAL